MERRKTDRKMEERDQVRPQSEQTIAYDLDTPLWSKYHREVRKNTRFPRYYKKSQNW